jgi:hypothetical protein
MRDASSLQKLAVMEAELAARVTDAAPSGDVRSAGGRSFVLRDGVWTDTSHREEAERIRVRSFSSAYFRILSALDEVRRAVESLTPVLVAGNEVSIEIGDEGREELTPSELDSLVRRFRGGGR